MMKKLDKKVTIKISQELYNILKKLATEDCRSVPSYIRFILQEHTGQR